MWALDALGKLDNFKAVFDIERYRQNYAYYMDLLAETYFMDKDDDYVTDELWALMRKRVRLRTRLFYRTRSLLRKHVIRSPRLRRLCHYLVKRFYRM